MHMYHYAPYETTALKRLAMRYMTREEELDGLLRSEVFVDLYATVRGSLRVAFVLQHKEAGTPLHGRSTPRKRRGERRRVDRGLPGVITVTNTTTTRQLR